MKLYFYLLGAALIAVMGCSKPESAGPLQRLRLQPRAFQRLRLLLVGRCIHKASS